jgi:hypothetical protein
MKRLSAAAIAGLSLLMGCEQTKTTTTPETPTVSDISPAQVALATKASDVTTAATGISMHPEYAKAVARMAYIWAGRSRISTIAALR